MLRIADPSDGPTDFVLVQENLDAASVPSLEPQLRTHLARGSLVWNLSAVHFADSAGLGLLVRLQAQFPGRLQLANVSDLLVRCLSRVPAGKLPPRYSGSFETAEAPSAVSNEPGPVDAVPENQRAAS